jgi:hypothetical protein
MTDEVISLSADRAAHDRRHDDPQANAEDPARLHPHDAKVKPNRFCTSSQSSKEYHGRALGPVRFVGYWPLFTRQKIFLCPCCEDHTL